MTGEGSETPGDSENQLVQRRAVAKSSITKIRTFVAAFDPERDDVAGLTVRSKRLDAVWEKYDEVQASLEALNWPKHSSDRDTIESVYEDVQTNIERLLQAYRKQEEQQKITNPLRVTQSPSQPSLQDVSTLIASAMSQQSLPTLNIKPFSGCYEEYRCFMDLFDSMIHNNNSIPEIQKFYHLKSTLTGEAADLIENLNVTASNYVTARRLLHERYNNEQFILNAHLKTLFEFAQIQKESVSDLRRLVSSTKQELQAINNMGIDTTNWDHMIIYLMKQKADTNTRKQWELTQKDPNKFPTLKEFYNFIEQRCFAFEAAQLSIQGDKVSRPEKSSRKQTTTKIHLSAEQQRNTECLVCKAGTHQIFQCTEFKTKAPNERLSLVKTLGLCFNCLRPNHSARQCTASKCRKCNKLHNTMLHLNIQQDIDTPPEGNPQEVTTALRRTPDQLSQTNTTVLTNNNLSIQKTFHTLLPTAEVRAKGCRGEQRICKILLDSGSQSNLITETLVASLKLKTTPIDLNISGITSSTMKITRKTNVIITSNDETFQMSISCLVIQKITEPIPESTFPKESLKIPNDIQLADPHFNQKGSIEILIGSDSFWSLLKTKQLQLNHKQLFLHDTFLGYIVAGRTPFQSANCHSICDLSIATVHKQIEQFWKIEESLQRKLTTVEEQQCEQFFSATHSREADGRYKVRLPTKTLTSQLGDSRHGADERLRAMERKMQRNPDFSNRYTDFMNEYINLGHMTEVSTDNEKQPSNYLPHHAVIKSESTTTQLRVVFDASYKTSSGKSLNDLLMVGPKIQQDSWDICIRFRQYPYVVSADIAKMYRQILVHEDDRKWQRILWRSKPLEPVKVYELNTVTYGMASSPFLAVRCLQQLAQENEARYPYASKILSRDFYVDDLLTGGATIESVKQLKTDLTTILQAAGFDLRKWKCNNETILDGSDRLESHELNSNVDLPESDQTTPKTLGLSWNAREDIITYQIKQDYQQGTTKRQILSKIAKLYDPLGLISPLIIRAKMIMQEIWQTQSTWDENVPDRIQQMWNNFEEDLPTLAQLQIPRLTCLPHPTHVEIHSFADASTKAYGAAVYIRSTDQHNYKSRLICSKTRVAPLKTISVPRLELCAAVLAAQLTVKVQETLETPNIKCTYWSDSTIVLHWIQNEPSRFQTFVANRISQIQTLTNNSPWKHIAGKLNPADLLSRGLTVSELILSEQWWKGPFFLEQDKSTWTSHLEINLSVEQLENSVLELKPCMSINHIQMQMRFSDIFQRFSSWTKLLRTFAYCMRFYKQLKGVQFNNELLSIQELNDTTLRIIKIVQREHFMNEIQALNTGQPLQKRSKLLPLNPFLKNDIIRVGGRLLNSTLSEDQKHPILLPADHIITQLLFRDLHRKCLHCGPEQLLSIMRLKYWPIAGRRTAKKITSQCIECFTFNPTRSKYLMGNLPTDRVQVSLRPFTSVGIDYAGPIWITESRRRGRVVRTKAYIAVFVCFNTKATHLELVTSLSTSHFLAALKRFIARRGIPKTIYSDNGTNFVGAYRELTEMYQFLKKQERDIMEECGKLNIVWKFQPPQAPNFGGLWESAVKSFKRHFCKVTKDSTLTFEECYTLLTQIESILNSRPLSPISSDPHDYQILTPSHFLIGDSLLEPPEYDYKHIEQTNKLSRFEYLQHIRQNFWKKWQQEYLHNLQMRAKWQTNTSTPVKLNDLVLLVDDNMPPLHWRRGRIVQIHPGNDGVIRVVTVQTSKGIYKRSVNKLCLFPNHVNN